MPRLSLSLNMTTSLQSTLFNSPYIIGFFDPSFVLDFGREYYRANYSKTDLASLAGIANLERGGLATMVNAAGELVWNPHNLLTYSEQFDNAAWVKTNATVTPNATVAPDGMTTAALVVSEDETSFRITNGSSGAGTYTASVWVKDAGRGNCSVAMGTSTIGYLINVDLTDGSFISGRSYGGAILLDYSIEPDGDFFFISVSATALIGGVAIRGADGTTSADGIYIWGAHLYRSDLGGMAPVPSWARGLSTSDTYLPTTSAARYLKRDGHHVNGVRGMLVEPTAATNLFTNSVFTTGWLVAGATLTANAVTSPDGDVTASSLVEDGSTGVHRATGPSPTITTATAYTASCYAKAGTRTEIRITENAGTGAFAHFDLSAGTVSSTGLGGSGVMEDVGGGWYRCSMTFTSAGTVGRIDHFIGVSGGISYTGDGTSGVFIYGAQLEASSVPQSYVPTSGATVTRLADTNGLPVQSSSLPWPTPNVIGPELVTNGTFDTDTDWTKGTGWTISGGLATHSGGLSTGLTQNGSFPVGKVYKVSLEISGWNGLGLVTAQLDGGGGSDSFTITSNGTYTRFVTTTLNRTRIALFTASGWDGSIDNISVREIDPLAVSMSMKGQVTYADIGTDSTAVFVQWFLDSNNFLRSRLRTDGAFTGAPQFLQIGSSVADQVTETSPGSYSPGINVPFNIASRHGSTFINGAVDGVALTADLTPTALPDLSTTVLQLGQAGGPMFIEKFVLWDKDLGDAGIAEATLPSLEPSLFLTFDGTEGSFTVSDWSA